MKHIILALALAFGSTAYADAEPPKTKQVCVDQIQNGKPVIDPKTNKPKQTCRTVKIHKKYEGTEIPDNKKK